MLTFDKIRDLERTERGSRKLQKMPENFIDELREYIIRKEAIKEKTLSDMNEMERIRDSIRKIFEMRQKKILESVFETVTGGSLSANLMNEEEELFNRLVDIVKGFMENTFREINRKEIVREERIEERREVYRVLRELPEFIGPDMKVYKLRKDEIVQIPKPLNEFLLKKGVIEQAD
ncbi:MAG: hypothetical protein QMD85_03205 [Candidatus Aenigmarchaeota archaeon]|nr:hypothetical protein [Candidatus Aenigmarchaeota archaeon]MDI6722543.1 hypothetical protein [Candidatus Aenigmarchaeota archaeon]